MKTEITVTVRKKHLTAALKTQDGNYSTTCLLAHAVKEGTKKRISVTGAYVHVGKQLYNLPTGAKQLISRFDKITFLLVTSIKPTTTKRAAALTEKLRESLPYTFVMTKSH